MHRHTISIGLALVLTACSVTAAMGCHGCGCRACAMSDCGPGGCGPGGCGPGGCGLGGCNKQCDRYAARPYRRHANCHPPRRDPRIPGPRSISTLPRQPEMAAPSFFVPVPTYPVFGPRSEEPDGVESQLQPVISDGVEQFEAEPLPAPTNRRAAPPEEIEEDDDLTDAVPTQLKLAAPTQTAAASGWKPKSRVKDTATGRPCAKCSVTFRPTNPIR